MTLGERLLAIHAKLEEAGVDHAIGGAIALGYWTVEPRGTRDIDVNVFIPPDECERALSVLPEGVVWDEQSVERIKRDGQIRLAWEGTPIDLFFSELEIHDQAARHRRDVPFEGETISVLGPIELAVFKAMFDRTRDWADIEEMIAAGTLDVEALKGHLIRLIGEDDARVERVDEAVRQADRGPRGTPPS